jgi:hypothetical protein
VLDVLPSIAAAWAKGEALPRGAAWPALGYADTGLRRLVDGDGFSVVRGRTYEVRTAGSVVELRTQFFGTTPVQRAQRASVSGFSVKSRRRLFKTMSALPWAAFGDSLFITLTYPPSQLHLSGPLIKRHLNAFRSAWARQYGKPQCVWKLEFQGARAEYRPHFHLAMVAPVGDRAALQAWVSATWFRIVGSGNDDHLLAGTQCVPLESWSISSYFAGYIGKSGKDAKAYQHEVPAGFENVGRFWGLWGVRPQWQGQSLSAREFVQLRRILYKLEAAIATSQHRTTKRRRGRIQSEWHRWDDISGTLLVDRVMRSLRPEPVHDLTPDELGVCRWNGLG